MKNVFVAYAELYAIVMKRAVKAIFAKTGSVNKVVETIMLATLTKLV